MKKRILTGDRPTGKLHLGHYVGTLRNRIKLQDQYESFFIVADLHSLTTNTDTSKLKENINNLVLDYLSVGIDPQKSAIYLQSEIPEVGELATIFSMLISVPRVQRVPTLKEVMRDLKIENPSLGLLSYPVLQAADILMVRANLVPVGKDQVSHIEITREIAQKFNSEFKEIFPVPQALIPSDLGILPGTDGAGKMSKSLNNAIYLADSEEVVSQKVKNMYTDPKRIHRDDPGNPEGNPVFIYLDAFVSENDKSQVQVYKEKYKAGKVGDVEVKEYLAVVLNNLLQPIREKRKQFEKNPVLLEKILKEGTRKAKIEASKTLSLVKKAANLGL